MIDQYREWSGSTGVPFDDWEAIGHHEQNELVAVAMLRGTEIHFAVAPNWRGRLIQRGRTRAFLAPLIERHGFLTTRSSDGQAHRFLKRLGFVETWAEGPIQHYMLIGLPFSGGIHD